MIAPDKEVKKILIFGMARTGTTIIQQILASNVYKIPNWNEPFNHTNKIIVGGQMIEADHYEWAQSTEQGVFKLLAHNLDYIQIDRLLEVGNFDLVVLTERQDLIECCLSLYWSSKNNKYHYRHRSEAQLAEFTAEESFVTQWCRNYRNYERSKSFVISSGIPYNIICYEDFMNDTTQMVGTHRIQRFATVNNAFEFVPSNLPYRKMCTNIEAIKNIINKEIYAKRVRT